MTSSRPVALVTGASRGIGRACAVALAAAGFDVALTARTANEGDGRDDSDAGENAPIEGSLERTEAEVSAHGARAIPLVADLTEFASLTAAVERVVAQWGRLDVLVLNAVHTGPGSMLRITDTPIEALETKLRANAVAQLVLVQAALPTMLAAGGGRIIAITSYVATHDPSAPVGEGGWGYGYAASKAAFHRLAGHLAVELGDQGIIAINVDPGHVLTERMQANAEAARARGQVPRRAAERAGVSRRLVGNVARCGRAQRPDRRGAAAGAAARPASGLAVARGTATRAWIA